MQTKHFSLLFITVLRLPALLFILYFFSILFISYFILLCFSILICVVAPWDCEEQHFGQLCSMYMDE